MSEIIDVQAIRAEVRLSQAALAEYLHVDQATISNWETGKHSPRGPARQMLLRLLEEDRARRAAPEDAGAAA